MMGNVSGPKIETQTWVFWYLLIIREAFSIVNRLVEAIGSGLEQLMSVNVLDGSQSTETSNLAPQKPRFPIDVFISNQPTSILVGNMNLPTVFLICSHCLIFQLSKPFAVVRLSLKNPLIFSSVAWALASAGEGSIYMYLPCSSLSRGYGKSIENPLFSWSPKWGNQ